jgi:hypothetical protein
MLLLPPPQVEGVWDGILARSIKYYILIGKRDELGHQELVRRARSVPLHLQKLLQLRHFGQDARNNTAVLRSLQMAPSLDLQVLLSYRKTTTATPLNFKRKMTVGCRCCCCCSLSLSLSLLSLSMVVAMLRLRVSGSLSQCGH